MGYVQYKIERDWKYISTFIFQTVNSSIDCWSSATREGNGAAGASTTPRYIQPHPFNSRKDDATSTMEANAYLSFHVHMSLGFVPHQALLRYCRALGGTATGLWPPAWASFILSGYTPEVIGLQVTPNCAAAIDHIRDARASKIIWIDAICIDQKNDREKAAQVQRMGRTYKDAKKTIIWLGPQAPDTGRSSILPLGKSEMTDMLQREWWTRVWIIQELCLSKNPVLLIGRREVDWDDFSKALVEYIDTIAPPTRLGKLAFLSHQAWRFMGNIGSI